MATTIRQASFIGGEIAPSLYGRVDVGRYQEALRKCRNAFVQYHGGVSNRPGTRFIGECGDMTRAVRLIPFEFSTVQAYVLEFGHQYMRVIKNGGLVIDSGTGGLYEIATPYDASDLFRLQVTQSADVMTICHPDYPVRELARFGDDNWQLTVKSLVPSIAAPTNGSGTPNNTGSETYRYKVTSVADDETGEESLPLDITVSSAEDLSTSGAYNDLSWDAEAAAGSYNVYKDDNGLFGYIGTTENTSFRDDFIKPDVSDTAPSARNPFDAAGKYPSTATYYQQRLAFAATNNRPQTLFMSKSAAYDNFTYSTPYRDDDAVTFTIASRQVNEIRHMIPLQFLVLLTSGGEWVVQGDTNDLLTPTSINVEVQGYRGSSRVPPIVIGNSALYVQSRGSTVRDLRFQLSVDGFEGRDLTVFVPHLLQGRQIVDWAWAEIPHYLVWAVRDDGVLLTLTYVQEQEVWGWARHDTDGAFESVTTIPGGTEDEVYAVVRRTVGGSTVRYLERIETRLFDEIDDAFFVDSGLSYDGRKSAGEVTVSASSYDYQDSVTITLSGATYPATVDADVLVLTGADGETCRFFVDSRDSDTQVTATALKDVPASLQATATSVWSVAVDTLAGLDHLEGKTVSILADGNVEPQQTVSSGGVTLRRAASVVHVGLPYETEIETLDIDQFPNESLRDKQKLVHSVGMVVERSRGIFAGESRDDLSAADTLIEWKQRQDEALGEPTALFTGALTIPITASWNSGGRVRVVQNDPLPLTILSLLPRMTVGGPLR